MKKLKPYEDLFDTHPLLNLVVPLILGIAFGRFFQHEILEIDWVFFILIVFSFCACWVVYRLPVSPAKKYHPFFFFLSLGMGTLGAGLFLSDVKPLQKSWPKDALNIRAMIVDAPKENMKSWRTTVKIQGGENDGRLVQLSLAKKVDTTNCVPRACDEKNDYSTKSKNSELLPGDGLLFHAVIASPQNAGNPGEFDFAQWLRGRGISGVAFCFSSQWKKIDARYDASEVPLAVRALRWREHLMRKYEQYFQGRDLAMLSAMTLGDKRLLDSEVRDVFSQTGVSHVLALSGLHLSILFCVYRLLVLSLCRRRWLYLTMSLVGIVGLWFFVLLSGFPISLVRAAIMFTIMQVLSCLRHDSFGVNNLAFAALVLLILSPQALFDVGFQLSFLSVLSIILFSKSVPCPNWMKNSWLLRNGFELFNVSMIAQLATGPLVAYYFHIVPIYGWLANFVAVPLAYAIVALGILFLMLPLVQELLAPVLGMLLRGMDTSLSSLSELPGSVVYLYPTQLSVCLVYLLYVSLLAYLTHRKVVGLYFAALLCVVVGGVELYAHRPFRLSPQLVFYNLRNVPVVHAIASAEKSYIWSSNYAKADSALFGVKRTFWKQENISNPKPLSAALRNQDLYYNGAIMVFDGKRVAFCCSPLLEIAPDAALPVDYLLLGRGAKNDLEHILKFYQPSVIILDGSLTDFYYEKYTQETLKMDCAVHDMRRLGALRTVAE